jgi:hypothetical protein
MVRMQETERRRQVGRGRERDSFCVRCRPCANCRAHHKLTAVSASTGHAGPPAARSPSIRLRNFSSCLSRDANAIAATGTGARTAGGPVAGGGADAPQDNDMKLEIDLKNGEDDDGGEGVAGAVGGGGGAGALICGARTGAAA